MALEWIVLGAAVGMEAVLLFLVSLPMPKGVVMSVVKLYKQMLQPMLAIIPFALFQLLDVYWKYEHRLVCQNEHCTTTDRDRFEKSTYKSQRNALLSLSAIFMYWMLLRYVHYISELSRLETKVTSVKDE